MQASKRIRYLKLSTLLLIFIAGVLAHQSTLPALEGNDEALHYNYAVWLRETWRLPDRALHDTNSMHQETGQPPLTYFVDAMIFDLLKLPDQLASDPEMEPVRNRWYTPPDWSNRGDNFNQFVHGPNEQAFAHPAIVETNRVGRIVSLFYAVLAVIGAYGIASEVFKREAWVWTATALFAFSPQMVYLGSMMSNDATTTAFATLAIWQTLVILRKRGSPLRLILVGVLAALAGLAKVSGLLVVPGALLAIWFDARNRRLPLQRLLINFALFLIPIVLIFGPWVMFGIITYGDPIGFKTHSDPANRPVSLPPALEVIRALPETYMSYWAKFGSSSVWMSPLVYILLTITVVLSLWGYIRYLRHKTLATDRSWTDNVLPAINHRAELVVSIPIQPGPKQRFLLPGPGTSRNSLTGQQIIVFIPTGLLALAALLYWQVTLYHISYAITGRLIYFAHGVFIMALTGGLSLLGRNRSQRILIRTYAIGVTMSAALVLAPVTITSVFPTPVFLTRNQLPALRGGPIDFDKTIRFLGYDTSQSPFIRENSLSHVTLCWEVLKPTTRKGVFSIKMFGPKAEGIAGRTSIFGMGHFPSSIWQPGQIFCDHVDVPVSGPLQPGQIYNVVLVVSDAMNTDHQWRATVPDGRDFPSPLIYEAVSAAGDMSASVNANAQNTTIHFPQLADLKKLRVTGNAQPGATVQLDLLWNVLGDKHADWREFLHLDGPNTAMSLVDGPPRSGQYPTWAWTNGEQIAETLQAQIPANLSPGDYRITVGFYDPVSGERLMVTQDGADVPDRSAVLLKFTVK